MSGVATQSALVAALNSSGAGEVDTINLAPGSTIVLTGPLRVTHSTRIVGNGASLVFTQGGAPWSGSASGAIYVANPGVTDIAVDLENFTIKFALAGPLRWYASAGSSTLFDPESSPYGTKAVIDTSTSGGNDGRNREFLTMVGLTVDGPPDFDAVPPTPTDAYHAYAGEPEIPLVETGDDGGTIAGSTFQGGSLALSGGPWTVVGNTHLGALAGSYTPSAFAFDDPHDVSFTSNHVYQSATGGTTFRLVNFAGSSYGDSILGNTFIGGQVGDEVTYVKTSTTTGFYTGINDSEVILTEAKEFLFEGTPASVSADGRLLVLPPAAAGVASRTYTDGSTGPGLIVSIVDAADPNAGTWYRVAQQVSASPLTFLMQDPLPKGKYTISVVAGFVGDTIAGNVIDLAGKSSTGIVLSGADFGTTVAGNTIEGGSTYSYPYTGAGILVESGVVSNDESAAGAAVPGRVRVVALPGARGLGREQHDLQLGRQRDRRGPARPRHRRRRRPALPDGLGHGEHVRLAVGLPDGVGRRLPRHHQRQRQPGEPRHGRPPAPDRHDRLGLLGQREPATPYASAGARRASSTRPSWSSRSRPTRPISSRPRERRPSWASHRGRSTRGRSTGWRMARIAPRTMPRSTRTTWRSVRCR